LLAILNTNCVKCPSDNVIANPWKIFDTTSTNQYYRMLLQVVANPWNVACHFNSVGEPNTSHFAES
jgi:hypothetical protein